MRTKRNVVLYLDKELIEKSKDLGFNLSKTFENHLKHLMSQFSNCNSVNNCNSTDGINNMGLPGFEPGSIEPKGSRTIDWSEYKQYLISKYAKSYAVQIFEHSRKYQRLLDDVNGIQLCKRALENSCHNQLRKLKMERVEACLNCKRLVVCDEIGRYEICDHFEEVEGEAWVIRKL